MEMTTAHSLCAKPSYYLPPSSYFSAKSIFMTTKNKPSNAVMGFKELKCRGNQFKSFCAAVSSSSEGSGSSDSSFRWILEPIGNGDCSHIGYKISMPSGFEIANDIVTVGRVPEKADIVIPVPTVSATHARIKKTDDNLLIMDLDSTNGTFIDEKRLQPGVVSSAVPGNLVTFGDTNLAIFRVNKLEREEYEDAEEIAEDGTSSTVESTS